jgi:hypothetical protein
MIPYLGCHTARDMLDAFADGELPMADQVAVESHLRWCRTCLARVEDLRLIGASIRLGSAGAVGDEHDARAFASLQAEVLTRIGTERDEAFTVRLRSLFQDMRLLWPALGATAAVAACLIGAMSVLHAASDEHPNSLARMIQSLGNPGSDCNPLPLDGRLAAPRTLDGGPVLDSIPEEDAVFALATVVTREGRIANFELLQSERASREQTATSDSDVQKLLDAVKSSRFEPAQTIAFLPSLNARTVVGGETVAVNMVWLVARTTVRGSAQPLAFESRLIEPIHAPHAAKPVRTGPPSVRLKPDTTDGSLRPRRSTTA